jgi:hypothetical protein
MVSAHRDGAYTCGESYNRHGDVPIDRPITQLTVLVVSPTLHPSGCAQGAAMVSAGFNAHDLTRQPDYIYWNVRIDLSPIPKLPGIIAAPTFDAPRYG